MDKILVGGGFGVWHWADVGAKVMWNEIVFLLYGDRRGHVYKVLYLVSFCVHKHQYPLDENAHACEPCGNKFVCSVHIIWWWLHMWSQMLCALCWMTLHGCVICLWMNTRVQLWISSLGNMYAHVQGRHGRGGGFLRLHDESRHTGGLPGDRIRQVWLDRHAAAFHLRGLGLLVVESIRPGLRPRFKSLFHHNLWPWAVFFTFLSLNFLICKVGVIMVPRDSCKDYVKKCI